MKRKVSTIICESINIILATAFAILIVLSTYQGLGGNIAAHVFSLVTVLLAGCYGYYKIKYKILAYPEE